MMIKNSQRSVIKRETLERKNDISTVGEIPKGVNIYRNSPNTKLIQSQGAITGSSQA